MLPPWLNALIQPKGLSVHEPILFTADLASSTKVTRNDLDSSLEEAYGELGELRARVRQAELVATDLRPWWGRPSPTRPRGQRLGRRH
jgi:hypothetical protein